MHSSCLVDLEFPNDVAEYFQCATGASEGNGATDEPQTLNLVLRVRNTKRELNDIKFDYSAK